MPDKPTLYDVLGLDPTATQEQVRKAYKVKALETHPDKLDPGASEQSKHLAEKRFHQVHEAFEILNDPQRRRAYDSRVFRTRTSSLPASSASQLPTDDVERLRRDRAEWARQQQARCQQPKPQIPKPTRSYTAPPPPRTSFPSTSSQPPKPAPVPPQKPQQTKSRPAPPIRKIPEEGVDVQLLETMMQGLRQLDPEWEQRRMSVLKRRADRMTSNARSSTVRT